MNDIADFVAGTSGFYRMSAVDQLLALAWFAETHQGRTWFDGRYLRACFQQAAVEAPDMSVYLSRLAAKKPPQLIKGASGYRLSGAVRRDLDRRLGGDSAVVAVTKTLADLPGKIPDLAERTFLTEALNCYRTKAYRAAIIMVWNLAYDHLVRWVLADGGRIQALNTGIAGKYPKKNVTITKPEDLDDLKESEMIEAMRTGRLIDKNTTQILKDKLNRRNMAAHPSRIVFTQHQADDMITDLVVNVILPRA